MYRFIPLMVAVSAALSNSFVLADDNSDQVDQIFARWAHEDSPGAAVAIVKNGKTLYSNGYGMANLEHNIPNTSKTIFHVASTSKQFTAFAIFLLEQDEKLSLDDDIHKHLPELPDFKKKIRIRHLIHHTSGLRDQWDLLVLAGWRMDDVITHTDVMEIVKSQKELNFSPGEKYLYCNSGYTLLAEIVKRVSGKSLKEFCHKRIFIPLKMNDTHFHDDHRHIVPNRSDCYWAKESGWQKAVLSYAVVGATSLLTTTEDLAKWQRNLEVKTVGSNNVHRNLENRAVLNDGEKISYAGGIYHGNVSGHATLGHSGGDAGYVCHVERFTKQNLSVIVLANTNGIPAAKLAHRVGLIYLDINKNTDESNASLKTSATATSNKKAEIQKRSTTSLPHDSLASVSHASDVNLNDLAGRYFSPELDTFYDFVLENDQLHLRRRKYGTQLCRQAGENLFRVSSGLELNIRFKRDPTSNKVSALYISTGRVKNLQFVKHD